MVLKKVGKYISNIYVNGTKEAAYTQISDSDYDISVDTSQDIVYAISSTITYSGANGRSGWIEIKDTNGNTLHYHSAGVNENSAASKATVAVDPAGSSGDWTVTTDDGVTSKGWNTQSTNISGVTVSSVTKS